MFESSGYQTRCAVCTQTKVLKEMMERQAAQAEPRPQPRKKRIPYIPRPPYVSYHPDPNEPWPEYIPPSPEEKQKKKEIKQLDKLFSLLVDSSLFIAWAIIWVLTSGWVTAIGFIAAIYIPFYLHEKQEYWRCKNAKYLYQI